VTGASYHRTVRIGEHRGWLSVSPVSERHLLAVDLATALTPALPSILVRLRMLFDLDARPDVIADDLACDPRLAACLERRPGLRVPGAFDPFEVGARAILGQQVSVRGASTLAGRLAERLGEPIDTPLGGLNRIAPTAEALAATKTSTLAQIGLPAARAESLHTLAHVVARGDIDFGPGVDPAAMVARLVELPGIGPWTAQYIARRVLLWPDEFPPGE
jgi:AraC family transcriptional regulator of adaptative response / DNA-3-methyladenine glycosylase II